MLTYQNNWKVYFSAGPGFTTEANADAYNLMRACLLTYSFFFDHVPDNDSEVDEARIRSQLRNTTTNFFPRHSGFETDGSTYATDYAPILMDIENWLVTSFQGMTAAQTFTSIERAKAATKVVREIFPNRRIAWYGWGVVDGWNTIKNWHSVMGNPGAANYATYRSTFNSWRKQCELILHGGTSTAKNNEGVMSITDFLAPHLYLPVGTSYNGSTDWTTHADCIQWSGYFREMVRQAKRIFQKPVIPYIQPFVPNGTTYLGDDFFEHMLDVALSTKGDTDGVIIYFPASVGWSGWREFARDWVAANVIP